MFLVALWFSLFFGVMVLVVLIVDTAIEGAPRFDCQPAHATTAPILQPEETGFRAGILGTIWLMVTTAVLAIPLGIGAAVYLEEFADPQRWYNRFIEVNLQNLAAVPSIVYGLLAVAALAVVGFTETGVVIGGAVALALLILPVIIITTREAVRAVPQRDPGRVAGAGRDGVADDLAADPAVGRPRHRHRHDPRPVPRDRRGGAAAHHRHRGSASASTPTAWSARSRRCRSRSTT